MTTIEATIANCNEARTALLKAYRAIPYRDYLRTDHWLAIRAAAIERSRGHCQLCGKTEQLHVHHNSYKNLGEERPEDLMVLCQGCHHKFHEKATPPAEKVSGGELKRREANPREIVNVQSVRPFVLYVAFRDDSKKTIDIEPLLGLKELKGLEDASQFDEMEVDNEGNVRWPNQVVLRRDFLYEWPKGSAELISRAKGDRYAAWTECGTRDGQPKLRSVQILSPYVVRLFYGDGSSCVLDFGWILRDKVFRPLKDLSIFNQVSINDFGRLSWPNGMYCDPAVLAKIQPITAHNADWLVLALKQEAQP